MKWKAILLSGHPGCGKTTVIQKVISAYSGAAGGFYTREMRISGVRVGFEIITLNGQKDILAHVDLQSSKRIGKYGVNLPALDGLVIRVIEQAVQDGDLVVIDEIGPMEIASQKFRQIVGHVLKSDSKMIGTISRHCIPFLDEIRKRRDIRLIEVKPVNRDELPGKILRLLQGMELDSANNKI